MKRLVVALALLGFLASAPLWAQYLGTSSVSGGGTMAAGAILTSLLTVDTDDSGLNADTVDGVEGAGLCKLVNTDGLLCTFDNADGTADVTAAVNDIFEVRTSGTGSILLSTDYVGLGEESGMVRGYIVPSSSGIAFYHSGVDTVLLLDGANQGAWIGDRNNRAASVIVGGVADAVNASAYTETPLFTVYGSGLIESPTGAVQTCDCGTAGTPNTVTCDIKSPVVLLTDGDADSCTVTFATTTADLINGYLSNVRVVVDSVGGGGTFDLVDQAGVLELTGAYSMGVNDTLIVSYYAGNLDAWQEESRSNL